MSEGTNVASAVAEKGLNGKAEGSLVDAEAQKQIEDRKKDTPRYTDLKDKIFAAKDAESLLPLLGEVESASQEEEEIKGHYDKLRKSINFKLIKIEVRQILVDGNSTNKIKEKIFQALRDKKITLDQNEALHDLLKLFKLSQQIEKIEEDEGGGKLKRVLKILREGLIEGSIDDRDFRLLLSKFSRKTSKAKK